MGIIVCVKKKGITTLRAPYRSIAKEKILLLHIYLYDTVGNHTLVIGSEVL
jgi:hypothetical protein